MTELQDGDIGLDQADRLYKWILKKWVAQGKSSSPVYPVVVIARHSGGVYRSYNPDQADRIKGLEHELLSQEAKYEGIYSARERIKVLEEALGESSLAITGFLSYYGMDEEIDGVSHITHENGRDAWEKATKALQNKEGDDAK